MTRLRRLLLIGIVVTSGVAAFFLRDVVYRMLVVPVAYILWTIWVYYSFVPQLFLWVGLLLILLITTIASFLPEGRASKRSEPKRGASQGEVETLAGWMHKAHSGNYFKWQIANRLGRIRRELNELSGRRGGFASESDAVENYFDAGINKSFVDFPLSKNRFRRTKTALDLNPKDAVDYLELQIGKGKELS
ncbi:MAG TPA: hypothetical protein VHM28_03335 [Anaerolineales bacterium]|nr:hypothetical protein [Anaerolineales bacterium]